MFDRRIFVVAPNFHGATLLSMLMNGHPAVVSLGDTYPSRRFDQECGCGQPVRNCPFWTKVAEYVDARRYSGIANLLPNYPRLAGGTMDRWLFNLLPPPIASRLVHRSRLDDFAETYERFTESVALHGDKSEPKVFIDGVKSVARVVALLAAGVRVDGVIHLYRDPNDFVKSSLKQDGGSWPTLVARAMAWRLFHGRARRLGRYIPVMPLSYEKLADSPDETLRRLFEFAGVEPRPLETLDLPGRDRPWHFVGNASLLDFDGRIRRRRHPATELERVLIRLVAGGYHEFGDRPARGEA